REALGEIVDMLRWLMLLRVDGEDSVLVPLTGTLREQVAALAKDVDTARLDAMIGAGLLGRDRLRRLEDRSAVFEVALVRMAGAGAMPTLADLLAQVRSGQFVAAGGQGAVASGQAAGVGARDVAGRAAAPVRGAPPRPAGNAKAAPQAPKLAARATGPVAN